MLAAPAHRALHAVRHAKKKPQPPAFPNPAIFRWCYRMIRRNPFTPLQHPQREALSSSHPAAHATRCCSRQHKHGGFMRRWGFVCVMRANETTRASGILHFASSYCSTTSFKERDPPLASTPLRLQLDGNLMNYKKTGVICPWLFIFSYYTTLHRASGIERDLTAPF